ncbi:MAG TPA: hypothetical protein VKU87_12475, partial [Thermomicrobiaceae bacterium]|nr:hypothetical protein [Thermomicrobiaceae bacterium]
VSASQTRLHWSLRGRMHPGKRFGMTGTVFEEVVAVQQATLTDMIMDGMTIRPAGSRAGAIVRT